MRKFKFFGKMFLEMKKMEIVFIILTVILSLAILMLLGLGICFFMAYYAPKRKPIERDEFPLPKGDEYEPYRALLTAWMKEVRALPNREFSVTSFDGLTLRAKYYEYSPDAPIELMFPGYRGDAERDLCGAVQRCFAVGHNAFLVDQRAAGKSDGSVITFGVKESRDVDAWLSLLLKEFPQNKIILAGVSMGAATVLLAAEKPLPESVIGVLADCGYSSAPDIIKKVIKDLNLPDKILYPLVRLSGIIFGGFDVEKAVPRDSAKSIKLPVIIAHGEADAFVPSYMADEIYESIKTKKLLVKIKGAGHGLAYPVEPEKYVRELSEFWNEAKAKSSSN